MRKLWVLLGLIATVAMVAAIWLVPMALGFHEDGKVTVCHRTGSDKNPYHAITTDNSGTVAAHIGGIIHDVDVGPPHPPKDEGLRPDFLLPGEQTSEDCKNADPDPKP